MNGMTFVATCLASFVLVGLVRWYALYHNVLDIPGARSSHRVPTPRGGGLGIVVSWMGCVGWYGVGRLPLEVGLGLAAVALTAMVGWRDDHGGLPVRLRLMAHIVAGLLLLPLVVHSSDAGPVVLALWLLWWIYWSVSLINVTNFMDGIDGLIGSQALIMGLHLWLLVPADGPLGPISALALAGSAAGFLCWNWPPARIFLGDVGSGAIGVIVAVTALLAQVESRVPFIAIFLPLFPIFLDASTTLWRRHRAGHRLTEAHRTHLYQRLANGGWGHARVTLLYAAAAALGATVNHAPPPWRPVGMMGFALLTCLVGWHLSRRMPRA